MINIMIAEDHSMIREGLKYLLELEPDIKVVADCSDGKEAVVRYKEISPDVVLLDINMPRLSGLDALKQIRQFDENAKIVILTIHQDREYLLEALELGALGYILKDAGARELVEAVRNAYCNKNYIQPVMTSELVNEFQRVKKVSSEPTKNLTSREAEVLRYLSKGMLNKEIAKELFISEKTVKNHVSSIFRKLNVQDRTQAAIFAIKNKIVD